MKGSCSTSRADRSSPPARVDCQPCPPAPPASGAWPGEFHAPGSSDWADALVNGVGPVASHARRVAFFPLNGPPVGQGRPHRRCRSRPARREPTRRVASPLRKGFVVVRPRPMGAKGVSVWVVRAIFHPPLGLDSRTSPTSNCKKRAVLRGRASGCGMRFARHAGCDREGVPYTKRGPATARAGGVPLPGGAL